MSSVAGTGYETTEVNNEESMLDGFWVCQLFCMLENSNPQLPLTTQEEYEKSLDGITS